MKEAKERLTRMKERDERTPLMRGMHERSERRENLRAWWGEHSERMENLRAWWGERSERMENLCAWWGEHWEDVVLWTLSTVIAVLLVIFAIILYNM